MSTKRKDANQLNMHLAETTSSLKNRLQGGEFVVQFETPLPLSQEPFDSAVENGRNLMKASKADDLVSGVVITDRTRGEECHDIVEVAEALMDAADAPLVLTFAGKNRSGQAFRELLARAESAGISGILSVTGDRSAEHPHGDQPGKRRTKARPDYLDSAEMIHRIHHSGANVLIGGTVNPFKYTVSDQYLQYYKALRKINSGSDYLVTHIGWDMSKLQALQWYLQMREFSIPVLARIALLSMEEINQIHEDYLPGTPVPKNFAAMLQREASLGYNQSLSAQLHRIGLQAAGCKLMGYSGVQIRGVSGQETANMVINRIREALNTYSSYPAWLEAWKEHHTDLRFSPLLNGFYTFRNLLNTDHPMYEPDKCPLTEESFPQPSGKDRMHAGLYRFLNEPPLLSSLTQRIQRLLCPGCDNKDSCRPEYCEYLCPAECPKQLMYGPCGNSSPDGTCEFGGAPCFFHRVLALAAAGKKLDTLESGIAS